MRLLGVLDHAAQRPRRAGIDGGRRRRRRGRRAQVLRKVFAADDVAVDEAHGALDHLLQLAHVERPMVSLQGGERVRSE